MAGLVGMLSALPYLRQDAAVGVAETMLLQPAPTTRLIMGRDGDLRIELVNNTGKALRNITVADRLPDGPDLASQHHGVLSFAGLSKRGSFF